MYSTYLSPPLIERDWGQAGRQVGRQAEDISSFIYPSINSFISYFSFPSGLNPDIATTTKKKRSSHHRQPPPAPVRSFPIHHHSPSFSILPSSSFLSVSMPLHFTRSREAISAILALLRAVGHRNAVIAIAVSSATTTACAITSERPPPQKNLGVWLVTEK